MEYELKDLTSSKGDTSKPIDAIRSVGEDNIKERLLTKSHQDTQHSAKDNISDHENQQTKSDRSEKELLRQDLPNILLLIVLYMYQGLMIGFFLDFTKNYLIQEKHISGQQIATLRSVVWAYSIKFLWAPFMDTYYLKSLGRRKTYLVPAQFLISLTLFFSAFYYEEWMNSASILKITGIGLICFFLITIQDIAVDSWSVQLLHAENVAYGSFCQSFGQRMGSIVGYQVFIYLSDQKLMHSIFGVDKPVLTPFSMCITMSISILLGTVFVYLFRNEVDDSDRVKCLHAEQQQQEMKELSSIETEILLHETPGQSFSETIQNMKLFFRNKSVQGLIAFLLISHFGLTCIEVPAEIILLKKGFSRSTMATIELCLIPFTQLVNGFAARLSSKKQEFSIWKWSFAIRGIWNIANYLVVDSYEKENEGTMFLILFAIIQTGEQIFYALAFIAYGAFFLRICDLTIGGTYITFLNSFANFGKLWPTILASWFSSVVSFGYFAVIGSVYNLFVFFYWRYKAIEMQESPIQKWKLKQQ